MDTREYPETLAAIPTNVVVACDLSCTAAFPQHGCVKMGQHLACFIHLELNPFRFR